MKIRLLLLPILFGAMTPFLHAHNTTNPGDTNMSLDYITANDTVPDKDGVIVVKKSAQQLAVSRSNMAKTRKSYDCPDIFGPGEPQPQTPGIAVEQQELPPAPTPDPPVKAKPFFLPDPVFFRINKWVIDQTEWAKIELAVNYLNANPGSTVVVTGYADKKTGNATINLRLSKERSNAVAKALETKYGIQKNRISVNWKGDGLQPFEFDNDKNRAVLFLINP